jgi:hypothetical protein
VAWRGRIPSLGSMLRLDIGMDRLFVVVEHPFVHRSSCWTLLSNPRVSIGRKDMRTQDMDLDLKHYLLTWL